MIEWNEQYSIGIGSIDRQHRDLFCNMNDLLLAMKAGKGSDEILKTLNFLEIYAETHFKEEEELQIKSNYSKYNLQKIQHDEFRNKLKTFKLELSNNSESMSLLLKVQDEITQWWKNHILELDMDLGQHLKKTEYNV